MIDVAALDVIDSFVARSMRSIVLTAKLRGAETVIVGIQPDVAIAMVQFRLNLEPLRVALDLDAAIALLDRLTRGTQRMEDEVRVSINPTRTWRPRAEGRAMAERLGFPDRIPPSSPPLSRRSHATSSCTSAVARSSSGRSRKPTATASS